MEELVLSAILFGPPLAYVVLQIAALRRWNGIARLLAALPVPVWLAWLASFVHDTSRDPTARNLFPLELLMLAVPSILYLVAIAVGRRLIGARRSSRAVRVGRHLPPP